MDITYISKVGDLSSQTMNIISRESKLFQKLRTASSNLVSHIASLLLPT